MAVSATEAILQRRFEVFTDLARAMARDLIETRVDYVAGDAMEGYNQYCWPRDSGRSAAGAL